VKTKKLKIVDAIYLVLLGFALAGAGSLIGWDISANQSGPAAFMGVALTVLLVHIVRVIREVTRD
jgi:hypothetical protein